MASSRHLAVPDPEYVALLATFPAPSPIGEDVQAWRDMSQNVVLPALKKIRGANLPAGALHVIHRHVQLYIAWIVYSN